MTDVVEKLKNILHNIKFKLKLIVFIPKLQKFLRKGGGKPPRLAHYVQLGVPGPILKHLRIGCSYFEIFAYLKISPPPLGCGRPW